MEKLATLFTCSYRELKHIKTVTICAMLGAVAIVISSMSFQVGNTIRIGFSGLPNELVHFLFGPVTGSLFAGAMDIIKYLIKPTGAFFPGFTLVAMLAGVIYGSFYYRKPIRLWRVFAAHFVVMLVCNVGLNTLCLSMLYGKAFMVILPARAVKNLILWPIDSLIFYNVAKLLEAGGIFRVIGNNQERNQ